MTDTPRQVLERLYNWATEEGFVARWGDSDEKPSMLVGVHYGTGYVPTEVVATGQYVSATVYGIDELPSGYLRVDVLSLMAGLNLDTSMFKFGADLVTDEVRCRVFLPNLNVDNEAKVFGILLAEVELGLEKWLNATKRLMQSVEDGRVLAVDPAA